MIMTNFFYPMPLLDYLLIDPWANGLISLSSILLIVKYANYSHILSGSKLILISIIPMILGMFGSLLGFFELANILRRGGFLDNLSFALFEQFIPIFVGFGASVVTFIFVTLLNHKSRFINGAELSDGRTERR